MAGGNVICVIVELAQSPHDHKESVRRSNTNASFRYDDGVYVNVAGAAAGDGLQGDGSSPHHKRA
jgi:uncharacterized protein with FMN-binding domain